MTSDDNQTMPVVRLRSDGAVDEGTMTYARTKIDTVVSRPGLPSVTGEIRITRAATPHSGHPWSATATLHVGRREVVVFAEAATGRELVDQLRDRLRHRTDQAAHTGDGRRHRAAAPPWRGGGQASPRSGGIGTATESPDVSLG